MEIHQVRYVLAVCETASFTRAAEQCNVSQPALTSAVKKLEAELGGPLFYRERKQVRLTELGQMMRPHFEEMLSRADAVRATAEDFRRLRKAPLHLGVLLTVGPLRLARFLSHFHRLYPGIEVAVHEGQLDELAQRLEAGAIELAVLHAPQGLDPMFRGQPLYKERYVVVFPPGHRFEALDVVRLSDVAGEAYVDRLACEMRDTVMALCGRDKIELYATYRSEREDWIQSMVMAEMGFAFMPEYSVTLNGMLSRPLVEPVVERMVSAVTMAGRPHAPAVAAFIRHARSYNWPR